MGKKWTTPEEEVFLENNVAQYEAAQKSKQVCQWLISFFLLWFLKFPEYSDGRKSIDRINVKKVSALPLLLNVDIHSLPPTDAATQTVVQ